MKIYRTINSVQTEIYNLVIDDKTIYYVRLMAEDKIICPVVVSELLTFLVGDYIIWNNSKYYINRDPVLDEMSDVEFRYSITFEGEIYNLIDRLFMLDRGTAFELTEFSIYGNLDFFVQKIASQVGWTAVTIGTDASITTAKVVTFSGITCREALNKLAVEFSAEFSITGTEITFKSRIENPTNYVFNRGKNAGLYNLSREPVDDGNTVTKAYIFGSTRNLTFLYGHPRLTIPAITNTANYPKIVEKNVIFESIWPQFIGTVESVGGSYLSVTCSTIDFDINDSLLSGIAAKIVFLDGDLQGNQFDLSSYDHSTKTIVFKQIIKNEQSLPTDTGTWAPRIGDKFTLVDISMNAAYITDAESRLTIAGTEWLNYYSKLRIKYKLVFDPRYLRDKPALKIGDLVTAQGKDLRIIGLQYPILYPTQITAEISNYKDEYYENKVSTQISDTLNKISEVKAENAISTVVLRHIWYDVPTGKLKTDVGLFVDGTIEASEEVIAWVSNAVSGTVLSGLTGQDPIYKVSESVVGLRIDAATLAIVGGKLTVIGGGGSTPGTGSGTVTSVELALPAEFNVSGSPLTVAGTLTGSWKSQLQAKVFASPAIESGVPSFRALIASDIPTLSYEPPITIKKTAFNKDFGTVAGTIAEGHLHPYLSNSDVKITQWNTAYTKSIPFTVLSDRVTIDRDLYVTGNITATKEVAAYIAGAVTSDVLAGLTGVFPLYKPTTSTIGIKLDANQFQLNASNELQIKAGTVQPSGNYATVTYVDSSIAVLTQLAPTVLNTFAELANAMGGDPNFNTTIVNLIATKAPISNPTFTGTVSGVSKAMVGLPLADNTSDANKSVAYAGNAGLLNGVSPLDYFQTGRGSLAVADINTFVNRRSGTYSIINAGLTDLLTVLAGNGGSASALEIFSDYSGTYKVRSTIDSNRYTAFSTLWHSGNLNRSDVAFTASTGTFSGSVTAPLLKLNTAGSQLQTLDVLTGISIQSTNNLTSTYLDFLGNQGNGWATNYGRGYRFEYNPSDSSFNLWQRAAQEGGAIKSILNFNNVSNATFASSVTATAFDIKGLNFSLTSGNGDDGSLAMCTADIYTWHGFGITPLVGGAWGDGVRTIAFNARNGGIITRGNITSSTLNAIDATFSGSVTATGLQINGSANATGNITGANIIAPLYTIRNASGVTQWTVSVGAGEKLEFKNASGVIEMTLSQTGAIDARSEITAYVNI